MKTMARAFNSFALATTFAMTAFPVVASPGADEEADWLRSLAAFTSERCAAPFQ
jgi:hypothetical protein